MMQPRSDAIFRQKKLSEQVFELLERQIVTGEMAPGSHLAEERIARELGISRSPVRQALGDLTRRGLAEWADGRDRRVAIPSVKFVADVFDTCTVLEGARICDSSRAATAADHQKLSRLLKSMAAARNAGRSKDYERYQASLRETLACRCHNDRLNQLSCEYATYRRWIHAITYRTKQAGYDSETEHAEIVKHYIARNISALHDSIQRHMARHRASIIAEYEQNLAKLQAKSKKKPPRRPAA